MAKIPFTLEAWLEDKSQKVETRDGRLVHNIWKIKEPCYTNNMKAEVCALIDGEEDALVFFEGGRYLPTTKDTDSPFDLFIITPEPELSEFEKAVGLEIFDEPFEEKHIKVIKEESAKLLSIASKELCEQIVDHTKEAYENGKAEALKDLPRWRYRKGGSGPILHDCLVLNKYGGIGKSPSGALLGDVWILEYDELAKLPKEEPGFKEDESHE